MKSNVITGAVCLALSFSSMAVADDLNTIFAKVNELVAAKNYPKALEELSWASKEIEKQHLTRVQEFLPNQLGEFTGEKVNSNTALGFSTLERVYKNATGTRVKVSLLGSSSSEQGAGLGGLAQLGKMAAMFGGSQGGVNRDAVRIDGRTANIEVNEAGKTAEMTVFLDSGSMLKFEMQKSTDVATLKKLAEAIKIGELDGYLRGTGK